MSELKAETIYLQHESGENYAVEFYLKSENKHLKKQSSCTFSDDCLRVRHLNRKLAEQEAENRKLKRALWLARAWRADDMYRIFCFSSHIAEPMNIRGFIERFKGCSNMRSAEEWQQVWSRVERKCRAKAEQYK